VGPRDVLNAVAKRKIPFLCQESNPGRPAYSLVAIMMMRNQISHSYKRTGKIILVFILNFMFPDKKLEHEKLCSAVCGRLPLLSVTRIRICLSGYSIQ
jgi:hypothetical protein